jgi:hypothetical protein
MEKEPLMSDWNPILVGVIVGLLLTAIIIGVGLALGAEFEEPCS